MSGFWRSNQVAIVGTPRAPSNGTRRRRSARLTVETARAAIADAGLAVDQMGRLRDGQPLPVRRRPRCREDGVSLVSANWLAEQPWRESRLRRRVPGVRPDPGLGRPGGQRRRERRRGLRAGPPGPPQPARESTTPIRCGGTWGSAVDRPPGLLRPTGHDRSRLQRVSPAVRAEPRGDGSRGGRGSQERSHGSRGPTGTTSRSRPEEYLGCTADQRSDLPLRLRHPGRRRRRVRLYLGRARRDLPHRPGVRRRVRQRSHR